MQNLGLNSLGSNSSSSIYKQLNVGQFSCFIGLLWGLNEFLYMKCVSCWVSCCSGKLIYWPFCACISECVSHKAWGKVKWVECCIQGHKTCCCAILVFRLISRRFGPQFSPQTLPVTGQLHAHLLHWVDLRWSDGCRHFCKSTKCCINVRACH